LAFPSGHRVRPRHWYVTTQEAQWVVDIKLGEQPGQHLFGYINGIPNLLSTRD
jgi:hypothetical protein